MDMFIFVFAAIAVSIAHGTDCFDSYSCASSNITDSTVTVKCYGYQSCHSSSIYATGSVGIYCDGSYACYQATTLSGAGALVSCNGLFSCAFVNLLYQPSGTLYCLASYACYNSTIITGNNVILPAEGYQVLSNSIIYNGGDVRVRGYREAVNTIFYSNDAESSYDFVGTESTENTMLYCGVGHTCTINCVSDSCNGLTAMCIDGNSSSCTLDIDCNLAEKSAICPNGYEISLEGLYAIPSLRDLEFDTYDNSYYPCEDSNAVMCDDYRDCYNETVTSDSGNTAVCCNAREGCFKSQNISVGSVQQVAIRCDGMYSCDEMVREGSSGLRAVNGGNIYLSARYAAAEETHDTLIETTMEYDIISTGSHSSRYKRFRNANNLYCLGWLPCAYAYLIENINNVWMYGRAAGALTELMININENVYCKGYRSCETSNIVSVGGDVYGSGYRALSDSNITDVSNNVVGLGPQALYASDINNATNLFCDGDASCRDATITSVSNIYANGNNSLGGSMIYSEILDASKTLIMEINGTNSDPIYLYCNETDTCRIKCLSIDACDVLYLTCLGSCFVECYNATNKDNNNCLASGEYGIWTTMEPTYLPSTEPSNQPSAEPTAQPSNQPTTQPTANPSNNPTIVPSSMPSNDPTGLPTAMPSIIPTSEPSVQPSAEPTRQSVVETTEEAIETAETTQQPTTRAPTAAPNASGQNGGESISGGGGDSGSNSGSLSESSIITIVIVICVSIVVILLALMIFMYATQSRKERMRQQQQNMQLSEIKSESGNNNSNRNELFDVQSNTVRSTSGTSAASLLMPTNATIPIVSPTGAGNDSNNNNNVLFEEAEAMAKQELPKQPKISDVDGYGNTAGMDIEDSHEMAIADLITDLEGNNNILLADNGMSAINMNNNNNYNNGAGGELAMEGNNGASDNATNGRRIHMAGGGVAGGPGAAVVNNNNNDVNEGKNLIMNSTYNMGIDESKYAKWNQKQVLIWLKVNLVNNGINSEMAKSFLKEFSTKCVTGTMLQQFKKDETLLKELQSQFTQKNQAFGLWMVFKTALKAMNDFAE